MLLSPYNTQNRYFQQTQGKSRIVCQEQLLSLSCAENIYFQEKAKIMSEQKDNTDRKLSGKKWSVVASLYTVWAFLFFLFDYLYILLTRYRRAVPLGLIVGVGFISYFLIPMYLIAGFCSIIYWLKNHKKTPIRAAIPPLIVCGTLIIYVLYVIFIVPHINGGGYFYRFILFEIERWLS